MKARPRFFEDFSVGQRERFGAYEVTREEVLEFASRYDPSPQHLDDAAAAANPLFGRIAASGAHSVAMLTRMLVDHWQARGETGMGSPGFAVRFLKPVYPGDVLTCTFEVTECDASATRPLFGKVHFRIVMTNQAGDKVLQLNAASLHRRRGGAKET